MASSDVSVIVVSFNTREKLRLCLEHIEPSHEIIVVDNASSDGSPEMVADAFPHVRLIRNEVNLGFGAANNVGMSVATRSLILFLNSDCYASPGAIDSLASCFREGVVAAGGKLLNPDGSLQESVARELTLGAVASEQFLLEKTRLTKSYWVTPRSGGVQECAQVMGACLMIRPLERFDERFFLYCEDTDLCLRLRRHGKILYCPDAVFTHELGSSSSGVGRWKSVARYNRGKELYFLIHQGRFAAYACWSLDRSGALLRLLLWTLATVFTLGRTRSQVALFWKVLFTPLQGPDRVPRTRR